MPRIDVEPRGGLVQEQQFGIAGQRQGEHHPLLLTSGELPVPAPGELLEARHGKQARSRKRRRIICAKEFNVLAHGQVRGDARDLEHRPPPNPHFGRSGCQTEYTRRALLHPQAPEEEADGGGLAGAVGPQHPQHLAPAHFQIEPVERNHRPVPVRHARQPDEGGARRCSSLHGVNVRGCYRGRFGASA